MIDEIVTKLLDKLGLQEWKEQVLDSEFTKIKDGKLVNLDLGLTPIAKLPEDAFSELPDIEMLNLSGMGLEEIPQKIFKPLSKLRVLGLRNNKLENINQNYFEHNSELELVNLEGNKADKFEMEGVKLIF